MPKLHGEDEHGLIVISQRCPVNPDGHRQEYVPIPVWEHVPPLKHGLESQTLTTLLKKIKKKILI